MGSQLFILSEFSFQPKWFGKRIEICTNYALLAFSSLLRSIVLKQIRITPIQKTCQNFLLWWFPRDFLISDNLAYQKCFVLQRLLYSGFIFTAILLYVYWMNRWVLVWIHFNVFKGDTQTKTLKRVSADHIQSAFSSIHVFFKKKTESNYVTFSYRLFLVCFQCIDIILDIIMD